MAEPQSCLSVWMYWCFYIRCNKIHPEIKANGSESILKNTNVKLCKLCKLLRMFSQDMGTHLHLNYELSIRHFSCVFHCTAVSFYVNKIHCTWSVVKPGLRSFFPVGDWIIWNCYLKYEGDKFKSLEKGKLWNSYDRFIIWFAFYLVKCHFHVYLLHKFNPNAQILSLCFCICLCP